MKRFLFVLVACLLLSGCGNEKVSCNYSMEVASQKISAEISAPIKDGKISKFTTKMTVEFKDEDTAKEYCKNAKESDEDVKVTCSGKKVITEATTDGGDEKVTKKKFIKEMEDEGFKCK